MTTDEEKTNAIEPKKKAGRPKGTTIANGSHYTPMLNKLPEGTNTKSITHLMQIMAISYKADKNEPETLWNCFCEYIELCGQNDMKVTNIAAYTAMGISKDMAFDWVSGRRRGNDKRYKELIEHVNMICSTYRESLMADGKINPVVGLWWQKNFDHFTDQPREIIESANALGEHTDSTELAKKYQNYTE